MRDYMTTQERVLEWLKKHRYLTVLDGIHYLGTTEVRHYVSRLIAEGHEIKSEFVKNSLTGQMYKRYWLVKGEK